MEPPARAQPAEKPEVADQAIYISSGGTLRIQQVQVVQDDLTGWMRIPRWEQEERLLPTDLHNLDDCRNSPGNRWIQQISSLFSGVFHFACWTPS